MICKKCGTKFEEGIFCPECGTKYDEEEARKKAEELKAQEEQRILAEQAEKERIAAENAEKERLRKEEEKRQAEELKAQEALRRQEEKEKRELELEKAKVEQERLATERAAHEVELARQQNELRKAEEEKAARAKEAEIKRQEELARTFNGTLYSSVDEMNLAKEKYETDAKEAERIKKVNNKAVISMILGLASWVLAITIIFWFPSAIIAVVFGIKALKEGTTKRGCAITGIVSVGVFVAISTIGTILGYILYM